MRHGVFTGRPAIAVGRPVDVTGRASGRPVCFPVQKGAGICSDVFIFCCIFLAVFFLLDFVGQPMSHTYQLPAQFHHTNGPLRWLPSRLVDHYLLLLLRPPPPPHTAAATPAACCCNTGCCNTSSCYRSVIRKEQRLIVWQGLPMLQQQSSFPLRQRHTRK